MSSSQNIVSVANISLQAMGAQATISNINEGSTQSNAVNIYFSFLFSMLGRTANWNCLRQQNPLTLLAAAKGTPENQNGTTLPFPPQPWLYSYSLPPDCLRARFIVPIIPNGAGSGTPLTTATFTNEPTMPVQQIPFKVAYGTDQSGNPIQVVLTNLSQAQMVYTVNQQNPQIWDSMFTAAFVATLAAWLVPALSMDKAMIGIQSKIATELVMQARVSDGDEGSTCQDHIPDWIRARSAGAGYGYGYGYGNNNYAGPFGELTWPG